MDVGWWMAGLVDCLSVPNRERSRRGCLGFAVASCGREESQRGGKEGREFGSGRTLFVFFLSRGWAVLPMSLKGKKGEGALTVYENACSFLSCTSALTRSPFLKSTGDPADLRVLAAKTVHTPAIRNLTVITYCNFTWDNYSWKSIIRPWSASATAVKHHDATWNLVCSWPCRRT